MSSVITGCSENSQFATGPGGQAHLRTMAPKEVAPHKQEGESGGGSRPSAPSAAARELAADVEGYLPACANAAPRALVAASEPPLLDSWAMLR